MLEVPAPEPFSYLQGQIVTVRRTSGAIEPNWKVVMVNGETAMLTRPKSPDEMRATPGSNANMVRNTNIRKDLLPHNTHLQQPPSRSSEVSVDPFASLRKQFQLKPDARMVRGEQIFGQSVTLRITRTNATTPTEAYPHACILDKKGRVTHVAINYAGTTDARLVPIAALRRENPWAGDFVVAYEQRLRSPGQHSTNLASRLKSLVGL